jgi:hypothetical protein
MGHSLVLDADRLLLQIEHHCNEDISIEFTYTHQRHGEGRYGIPLASESNSSNECSFLTGIIETSDCFSFL